MKKIRTYIWEYKWPYLAAVLSMLIAVSLDMLSPQLTKSIVDDVIIGGQMNKLMILLGGILAVGVGRAIFQYTKEYLFDITSSKITADLRKNTFNHVQSLSADYFDKTGTGELMARIKDDVDRIWDGLGFVSMLMIEIVLHTVIILFCMIRLNPIITILPVVAMITAATIAISMEKKLDVVYEEISDENSELNTVAEENLAGVRTVKAFAREKHEIGKFLAHNQKYYDLNMKQSKVFVTYYPFINLITSLLPVLTLLLGGYFVMKGNMTLGALTAFVEYSFNIVWPMEMLGWITNSLSAALASSRKLQKIYEVKPSIVEPEHPVVLDPFKGSISFDHVSFHKEDGYEILHDVSFHVEEGKSIGIMGATGAGKTSIIYLLQRLYDATGGEIRIDGVDIKDLSLKQLRGNISAVMQDVFLFSETINENVKLGKKELLDNKAVQKASRMAQADEFIERMEDRYDTVIGERGVGLSGGQKQRIAIARALAKKDRILVLDDSTSALDMETEAEIQQTLKQLDHTTKIIIAHRISSVKNADEIIILDKGQIAERGTHEELLALKGRYYQTYLSQYGDILATQETSA
ncbi:MAG: ABC transporter ATP-binding protein/permease [Lachnospiraceae bacterium]|nr:ABC transporter ATP-binding protein/permease [Lachnospiraceae bacterium]